MNPKVINILQEKTPTINGAAFVSPLFKNRKRIKNYNIEIKFYTTPSTNLFNCDVLIITSKFAKENQWWQEYKKPEMFRFLEKTKKNVRYLIWADLSDGTGTTHFEILPQVDRYFKAFTLRDKNIYQTFLYGSRFNTDYYHKNYGIQDDNPGEPHLNVKPSNEDLKKIKTSWNQAFYNFTYFGYNYMKIKQYLRIVPNLNFIHFTPPSNKREILFNCRISTNYRRNTVSFQRQKVVELLNDKISSDRVGIRKYFNELKDSRVVISPFGWGEVCYRDFETIIAGATLMKPACDHMETWPNFYKENKTYLSFKWDFTDFNTIIESLSDREEELVEIAQEAQDIYRYYLFSDEGKNVFCERFSSLVSF